MKKLIFLGFVGLVAAPSSAAITLYFSGTPKEITGKLSLFCVSHDATILEQDEYHVLCSKQVSGLRGALTQSLIGNSYSTSPEVRIRFQIISNPASTLIQVSQWVQTQMAFGQLRTVAIDGAKENNRLTNELIQIGASQTPPEASSSEKPKP